MKRILSSAVIAVALTALLSSCGSEPVVHPAGSWSPKPQQSLGLQTIANTVMIDGVPQLALHTEHGDVTFWGGVNVGTTIPGHNPGELAIPRDTFREWFPQMASMGVHFVRTYTIMTPDFYAEFASYNNEHPDAPLYLVQGIYLPDESYAETGTLLDTAADQAFTAEIADASAAVHGNLTREPTPGRASGTWSADVSAWVAGWIIGSELDPLGVQRTDELTSTPQFIGTYFTSTGSSSPTERWLARHMDELATAEATHGTSAPIAFVNWPTADPLAHPQEPNPREDLVTIEANRVLPTAAWPGGTFASYHVYPYYPDFMRYETDLQQPLANGKVDPYLAYVAQLKAHHAAAGIPLLVSEFGVPASIGAAHYGTNGRSQGAHTEQEAMAMDAQMLRGLKSQGISGAFLFIWADEWFKFTWNTHPRMNVVDPERRSLWHDPLTNEQWFGVIASDPVANGWSTPYEQPDGLLRSMSVQHDESFVYLEFKMWQDFSEPFMLGFNIVPGGRSLPGAAGDQGVHDVAIKIDPGAKTADAYVVSRIDPILLDGLSLASIPDESFAGWSLMRLTANRALAAVGGLPARDAEYFDTGHLVHGVWDTASSEYNSLATWWLDRDLLELRIPWSMLLLGDPSSLTAVVPNIGMPTAVKISGIGLQLVSGKTTINLPGITWDEWNRAEYTYRVKAGSGKMSSAWHAVAKP